MSHPPRDLLPSRCPLSSYQFRKVFNNNNRAVAVRKSGRNQSDREIAIAVTPACDVLAAKNRLFPRMSDPLRSRNKAFEDHPIFVVDELPQFKSAEISIFQPQNINSSPIDGANSVFRVKRNNPGR